MTDRPQGDPLTYDDRTRDITLPPLPGRPRSALPQAWAELRPVTPSGGATAAPDFSAPPPALPAPVSEAPASGTPAPVAPPADAAATADPTRVTPLEDQPTDQLRPPDPRPRERTLAFSSPEMTQRPARPVRVGASPRRWPWVVLVLLPLLVITGAAVAWLLLIRSM
jgi:hypothetical protein